MSMSIFFIFLLAFLPILLFPAVTADTPPPTPRTSPPPRACALPATKNLPFCDPALDIPERVADLLKSDHDGAFEQKEAAATKARMQWQPTPDLYREAMSHNHGLGHGPALPDAPGGFGNLSVPDLHRVPGHSNAPPPETQVKMDGPASATKDWRTEGSRIGRYWANNTFQLKPNGTWDFNKDPSKGNAFDSRLF